MKISKRDMKKLEGLLAIAEEHSDHLREVKTTPEERSVALEMANNILKKYGMTLSEFLTVHEEMKIDVIEYDITDPRGVRAFGNWKRVLIADLAKIFGTYAFKTHNGLRLIGKRENTMRAVHFFQYFVEQIESRSNKGWLLRREMLQFHIIGKQLLASKRYGVIWKNNFHFGSISVLSERMRVRFGIETPSEVEPTETPQPRPAHEAPPSTESPEDDESDVSPGEDSPPERWSSATGLQLYKETKNEIQKYIDSKYQRETSEQEITMTLDRDGLAQGRIAGQVIPIYLPMERGVERTQLRGASARS